MRPAEAENLLGGYATGTLTEEERQRLFASALDHQEIFDALMDEEALRELLADPAVKAQLILALAHSAAPKVVPFWRRTGVLGAAASLLVAATAGLVYLRSDKTPPPLQQESAKAPLAKPVETPATAPSTQELARKVEPREKAKAAPAPISLAGSLAGSPAAVAQSAAAAPPAPQPAAPAPVAAAPAPMAETYTRAQSELRATATQDHLAKKAEVHHPTASAAVEVVANRHEAAAERKAVARDRAAGGSPSGVPGSVPGGVIGGVVGGVVGGAVGAPWWQVESGNDQITHVTLRARRDALLVLLKRGAAGITMLKLRPEEAITADLITWRCDLLLAPDEALDLYRLNKPVPDPSLLPETGPVDGLRVRIHPKTK